MCVLTDNYVYYLAPIVGASIIDVRHPKALALALATLQHSVLCALPVHPSLPVLQGLGDRGANHGRGRGGEGRGGLLAKNR